MEELRAFLRDKNVPNPEAIVPDGKLKRFKWLSKKQDGWFIGFINQKQNGGTFICAVMGSFASADEKIEYKPDKLSHIDRVVAQERYKEARKTLDEEAERKYQEAIKITDRYLMKGDWNKPTEYTKRKGLDGLYGAVSIGDSLIIPCRDIDGNLHGGQKIFANGDKRFVPGTKKKGNFFAIGPLDDRTYLCEGYATAVSVHMATGRSVVVAFDANNMVNVAAILSRRNVDLIICGDDDRFKEVNAGREAATKAAEASLAPISYPVFESKEKGTDWNDLMVDEGIDALRFQLADAPEKTEGFAFLGFNESTHYFFHIPTSDIVKITGFSKTEMLSLAPLSYWEKAHETKNGEVAWTHVIDTIIQHSKACGLFNPIRIRGTGVWEDAGRTVINTGDRLIVDRRAMGLGSIKSRYIYVQTINCFGKMRPPIERERLKDLFDAALNLNWKQPLAGHLLIGWLAIGRIAGALPIRPHIWLTGGSGTGKSTLMQGLIAPALGTESAWLYMQGTTTEAGLRQSVKGSSIPVIFDEFETTDSESKRRLGQLVQLMRNTWSSTGGTVTKGSPNGATINYQLSFPCLVSSIRLWLTNDADVSRFTVLELDAHDRQNDKWDMVKTALDKLDVDFGERLFSYMSGRVPVVLSNYKLLQAELAAQSNQRFGQQIGMLLAGFYALHSELPLSEEEARAAASDAVAMSETDIDADHFECLRHLLTWRFEVFDGGMRTKRSLESILDEELDEPLKRQQYAIVKKDLLSCGIKIEDNRDISIDQSHVEIKRIFRDTRWESSWATSLLRIDGTQKKTHIRFTSARSSQRGIFLPFSSLK